MSPSPLEQIFRALLKAFCGGSSSAHNEPDQYTQQPSGQQQQQGAAWGSQQQQHAGVQPQGQPAQSPPHSQSHAPSPHHRPQDTNQVNQHNEHYMSLRARANAEGDAMAQCFQQSHTAYSNGDGALAKELSEKGKAHERTMGELNKQASDWIFVENNKDSKPGEVDLHGLYVKEAIAHTDQAIQEARRRGDSQVHLIVGKGLHSPNQTAKLKPAIEELMQKERLVAELDPHNSGVLIVYIDGQATGRDRGVGVDDIAQRLEGKEEGCVVM